MFRSFLLLIFSTFLALPSPASNPDSLVAELNALESESDDIRRQEIQRELGIAYHEIYEHDEALKHFQISLDLARKLEMKEQEFYLLNQIGTIYFWLDNYANALESYLEARELGQGLVSLPQQAENLSRTAEVYISLGNYKQALVLELDALDISIRVNDSLGIANSHRVIGTVYWYREMFDQALDHLRKSLKFYRSGEHKIQIYTVLAAMSSVYTQKKQPEEALKYATESLEIAREIPYTYGIAFSTGMIGTTQKDLGQLESAETHVKAAIEQFDMLDIKAESSDFQVVLAEIYTLEKKYKEAINILEETQKVADEIQSKQLKSLSLKAMADNYEKLGKHTQALAYFRQYASIKDSLINEKDARQMAILDAEFELKRQQDQINRLQRKNEKIHDRFYIYGLIAGVVFLSLVLWLVYIRFRSQQKTTMLLEAKNAEIQKNNQQLARANQDLINLTDLISNDVVSPLHHISAQAERLEQNSDSFDTIRHAAKTIKDQTARIESLLTGLKLKMVEDENSVNLEKIRLADIIREATASLPEALKRQPIKIRFNELPEIPANRRQMVKLFQYFLTNATRFRREEDPVIAISYTRQEGHFLIVFEDNSKGLPQTEQEENFCRIVVEAHGGKFFSQSDFGKGNIFYIKIPE
ncbi:MAG: tetratricopeptide repeat protein [Bacteroidia bacterium]|nr:tetratricopeptide repeat protein [Bacteroidia bacterium]